MRKFLILLLLASLVTANGGMWLPDFEGFVTIPSQKAVIAWDGQYEELTLSTKIKVDDISNVAWIIPIESKIKPEVEQGDIGFFYELAKLFMWAEPPASGGIFFETGAKAPTVEIVEEKTIDIYDIVILKATSAVDMVTWLQKNGYSVPTSSIQVLQNYCDKPDFYFIANKINLESKYPGTKVTSNARECLDLAGEDLYWYTVNYDDDTALEIIGETLSYVPECEGVSPGTIKALVELEEGIATPLKITFEPHAPFYPMEMSSVNSGGTYIIVYVLSDTPMLDSSGMLEVEAMTDSAWVAARYDVFLSYATMLSYTGELETLEGDSVFIETEYDPYMDPNIYGPHIDDDYDDIGFVSVVLLLGLLAIPLCVFLMLINTFKGFTKKKTKKTRKTKKRRR